MQIRKSTRNLWLSDREWVDERNKILETQWHRRKRWAVASCCRICTLLSSAHGLLPIGAASSSACSVHYSPMGWLVEGTSLKAPQISKQSSWGCRAHVCSSPYETECWIELIRNNHTLKSSARAVPSSPAPSTPSFSSTGLPTPALPVYFSPNDRYPLCPYRFPTGLVILFWHTIPGLHI